MERKKRTLTRVVTAMVAALWTLLLPGIMFVAGSRVYADAPERGVSLRNYVQFGGIWSDAEKSPTNPNDDMLCWAATAANVLDYTGWGHIASMSNSDQMFTYYQNHWTDVGGLMDYAWGWWLSGVNGSQGWSGWSQVYSPGGGFYPGENFWDHYHEQWTPSLAMSAVDEYTRAGYGVGLAVYGPGAHAITCWGYNYDPSSPSTYYGVWVTDSDDDKYLTSPPDRLRYYDVAYSAGAGRWYLQNFYGSNSWYIGGVEAFEMIPEPGTVVTLLVGLVGLLARRRNRRG